MTTTGRGAWTRIGFPANAKDGTYTGLQPEAVGQAGAAVVALDAAVPVDSTDFTVDGPDLDHRAVNEGVKQLQHRMFHLAGCPVASHPVDGILDGVTWLCIFWAQHHMGLTADGRAGPTTCKRLFWSYLSSLTQYTTEVRHIVGGIAQHESAYDPGAVGWSTPDDLGLVQINGAANPTLSESDRFDYEKAFDYACRRISAALGTPGFTVDAAICSYGYPAVAHYWAQSGTETYPADPTLNDVALKYVAFIKNWTP